MSDFSAVRDALTDAFASIGAVVYDYTPPTVSVPCVFCFAADPYLVVETIGTGRITLRLRLTAAVAMNDNQASLNNIEDLMIDIINAMPSGVRFESFSAPSVTQYGVQNLLVSEMTVEVTTQTT